VLHTANTLKCFEHFFLYTKNIESFENVFLHGFLKHIKKKFVFLHFWILQYFCKTPKGIGQYSKKYKNLILWGIHLLFTANVWIKKILKGRISKILLRIINPHTSLKEAMIIIEDISKFFYSTVYEPWEYKTLKKIGFFLKCPRFLNFCPPFLWFTSRKLLKY
jgi:hypothetical protein